MQTETRYNVHLGNIFSCIFLQISNQIAHLGDDHNFEEGGENIYANNPM